MLYNINSAGGGGSNGLALKVIGTPTQPSNPKYPTIWVQTSVPISAYEMGLVSSPTWGMSPGFVYLTTQVCDYDDTVVINPFKKNFLFVKSNMCWQNLGAADAPQWRQMNAWLYAKNNEWVQISIVFAATINVTYPAGSTCTATNGTYTLTAPDTSGTWACIVPIASTWTISCTDGTRSESTTADITTNGQTATVGLDYKVYLFNNGYVNPLAGGFSVPTGGSVDTTIYKPSQYSYGIGSSSTNMIDVTNYSKLYFTVTEASAWEYSWDHVYNYMGLSQNASIYLSSFAAKVTVNSPQTAVVDISSISGSYYVQMLGEGMSQSTSSGAITHSTMFRVSQIWLEK